MHGKVGIRHNLVQEDELQYFFSKKTCLVQFIVILLGRMNYVFSKHVDKINRKP